MNGRAIRRNLALRWFLAALLAVQCAIASGTGFSRFEESAGAQDGTPQRASLQASPAKFTLRHLPDLDLDDIVAVDSASQFTLVRHGAALAAALSVRASAQRAFYARGPPAAA